MTMMITVVSRRAVVVVLGAIACLAISGTLIGTSARARHAAASRRPDAVAVVKGSPLAPNLKGRVSFRKSGTGTLVTVSVSGLPAYQAGSQPVGPFGFHIHEKANCDVGDPKNPFVDAGGHWNPTNQPHGNHAGDLPVLFSNHGKAFMTFYTDRFTPEQVMGKSVVIHLNPDDYRTQPSGDSGTRIGCGVIATTSAPKP